MVDWGLLQYLMYVEQWRHHNSDGWRRPRSREDDAANLLQLGCSSTILLCVAKVNQELGLYAKVTQG